MKKLFMLLAAAFMLAGCPQKSSEAPASEPATVEPSEPSSSEPSEPSSSEPEIEGMSPQEALTEVAANFGGSVSEVQEGVYGVYGAFSAASYSVEDMKGYVSSLFVPEEFELISDWAESDGAEVCYYANAVSTVLEFYVYAETLYVDADGYIVDEGTEGATAVEATCIEVYSYTSAE